MWVNHIQLAHAPLTCLRWVQRQAVLGEFGIPVRGCLRVHSRLLRGSSGLLQGQKCSSRNAATIGYSSAQQQSPVAGRKTLRSLQDSEREGLEP